MTRLGIIGTGGMAASHARSFSAMKGVTLSACCDVSDFSNGARVRAYLDASFRLSGKHLFDFRQLFP